MYMCVKKFIFSMRVHTQLFQRGFKPIEIRPDKKKEGRMVWVYEYTPELEGALSEIFTGVSPKEKGVSKYE